MSDLGARLVAANAEIARHHADFERWEAMADKGARQIEANRIYAEAIEEIADVSAWDGDVAREIALNAMDAIAELEKS